MLHLYLLLGLGVETVVLLVYESYWGAVLALGLVEDLVENLLVLDVRSPGECVVIQVAVFEVDDRDYFEDPRVRDVAALGELLTLRDEPAEKLYFMGLVFAFGEGPFFELFYTKFYSKSRRVEDTFRGSGHWPE